MVGFPGGPLAWGLLSLWGLSGAYALWYFSGRFWRTKFGDPEWRRYADGWSWVGIGLLAVVSLGAMALGLCIVVLNAAWYLTH